MTAEATRARGICEIGRWGMIARLIAAAAGLTIAVTVWPATVGLRRRRTERAAGCCPPAGVEPNNHPSTVDIGGR
jgi:hypothetical protein